MAFAVALAALVAACSSGGDVAPTTTAAEATTSTTAVQATTAAPTTTTTLPPSTTTSIPDQVGDPEALREFIDQIRSHVLEFGYSQFDGIEIPYPDLSSPDPIDALHEAFAFEAWLLEIGPYPSFAESYNYLDSPRRREVSTRFSTLVARNARYEGVLGGFEILTASVIPIDRADLVDHERDAIPPGSVAIEVTARGGPEQIVDLTTNAVLEEIEPYEGTGIVIMSPSELGWQPYWEGDRLP